MTKPQGRSSKRTRGLPGGIFAQELRRLAAAHPLERTEGLERFIEDCRVAMAAAADMRAQTAADLREQGLTWREVGELLGVTTAQAHNIATGRSGERQRKRQAREESESSLAAELGGTTSPEVREVARAEAERASETLLQLGKLASGVPKTGGEWDWYRSLSTAERGRLALKWIRREGVQSPDTLAEAMAERFSDLDPGDIDGCMQRWLELTRIADCGRSVASGRTPDPARFGGMTGAHFGQRSAAAESEPWMRELQPCEVGPSPADMTYEEWTTELEECGRILKSEEDEEWSSAAGDRAWRRYLELLPRALDASVGDGELFRQVQAGYRVMAMA